MTLNLNIATPLRDIVFSAIQNAEDTTIPFSQFMELILYTPNFGYYRQECGVIARDKDFVTAPEISPLFSACIAQQCAEIFGHLSNRTLLEVGAGNGRMAADILLHLEQLGQLPDVYMIIEPDPHHQRRQQHTIQERCSHLQHLLTWLPAWPSQPIIGIVVANELFDALPIDCYVLRGRQCFERRIGLDDQQLVYREVVCPSPPAVAEEILTQLPTQVASTPYHFEVARDASAMLHAMSTHLQQGVILLFDYGYPRREYYHPTRHCGHVLGYYQQKIIVDVLSFWQTNGFAPLDISCHVDFTALNEMAEQQGLMTLGFCSQAAFLLSCGLLDLFAASITKTSSAPADMHIAHFNSRQMLQLLTSPAEMGEIIKAIAFAKDYTHPLQGFTMRNLAESLMSNFEHSP